MFCDPARLVGSPGRESPSACGFEEPDSWHEPDMTTATDTTR